MIGSLRVHVTGSAALDTEPRLLAAAQTFVQSLARRLIEEGAGLLVGAAGEPLTATGLPATFDWGVLTEVAEASDPAPHWPSPRPDRFVVVASQRGVELVPSHRAEVWRACLRRTDFELLSMPPGWRMGGIIRESQGRRGDVLLVLGGGAGVEHLANLYRDEGKPVIPIDSELKALSDDGNGGGRFLYEQALGDPDSFLELREGSGSAVARLSALRLHALGDLERLVEDVLELIASLKPRRAFYVRLLDPGHPDYGPVERFFRGVVDPVVADRGFRGYEVGRDAPTHAFVNVEIFAQLHRAGLVVVDLTGSRPNCLMELGYALARKRRVIVSAKAGTQLPFDSDKLPTYFWKESFGEEAIAGYREWFDRNGDLPPLVD